MNTYQLEIHHVDVTGGDATLIVIRRHDKDENKPNPVVNCILVDTGGIGSGSEKLIGYLKKYFPDVVIDLMIISHYHDDHVRGIGLSTNGSEDFFNPKKLCDIGHDHEDYYPATTKVYENSPSYLATYRNFSLAYKKEPKRLVPAFLKHGSYTKEEFKGTIERISIKDNTSNTNTDTGFYLTFWSGKGVLADGTNIIKKQAGTKINPNDLSISFTIHNPKTDFSYFSGGDLSGDPELKAYHNIEGPAVDLMAKTFKGWNSDKTDYKFEIKVVKATHHGSNFNNHKKDPKYNTPHNSAPGFLETLQPEFIVVPCNMKLQVPSPIFIGDRLSNHLHNFLNRHAYFLNEFIYEKTDRGSGKEMSDAIAKLRKDAPGGTNILLTDDWYYTNGIGSIVVIAKSDSQATIVTPAKMNKLVLKKFSLCYSAYINEEEIEQTSLVFRVSAPRLRPWIDLKEVWKNEGILVGSIKILDGFKGQAQEIFDELSLNISKKKIEVLKKKFPALLNHFRKSETEEITEESILPYLTGELPDKLVTEMVAVFEKCYSIKDWWVLDHNTPAIYYTTLANLLYYNKYQFEYNRYWCKTNNAFIKDLPVAMWGEKKNEEKEKANLELEKKLDTPTRRERDVDEELFITEGVQKQKKRQKTQY
ncbi:MAG TPA: hypothetical protein VHA56_19700 [Mucilaginibacter sp.]|nr:hypothetical protein [Mucilaginibacter sp.]